MQAVQSDRIEKRIVVRAPRSRVWRALTDSHEFGRWFGVRPDGPFKPGARSTGAVTHKGYEHLIWDVTIVSMEPESRFSWRWHPGEVNAPDVAHEPTTLVVFELEDVEGGTLVKVIETGFDAIPATRRADAFRSNDGGWGEQMEAIRRHVEAAS
ncbi:MAG TPA: SRPBCC family protein [Vicinamibacterales bacterium]|nr:SRPBCC family protein [Vicinamibacterales bacterium]